MEKMMIGSFDVALPAESGDVVRSSNASCNSDRIFQGSLQRRAFLFALFVAFAPLTAHAQDAHWIRLAFSPDSKTLASGGGDRIRNRFKESDISLWDLPAKRVRSKLHVQGLVADLAFSPDGERIAVGFDRREGTKEFGEVKLFDANTGQDRMTLVVGAIFGRLFFSPTQKILGVSAWKPGDEWVVDSWDLDTQTIVRSLRTESLRCMVLTKEGMLLATSTGAGPVELWDIRNGEKVATATSSDNRVSPCLAYSPGSNLLAQGTVLFQEDPLKGEVRLLDGNTLQLRQSFAVSTGGVSDLTFSPDGSMLAVATIAKLLPTSKAEGELSILNSKTGEVLKNLGKHRRPISSLAFSPNGLYLASADESGAVKMWETRGWATTTLQESREHD